MRTTMTSNRAAAVAVGLFAVLAIAYMSPHEPTYAGTADRDSQFMMVTVPIVNKGAGNADPLDAVFILDFVTGQLKGAALNSKTGKCTSFWMRNLAKDFGVQAGVAPRFCFISGHTQLPVADGVSFASGVLFVGELTTGKVSAYSIPLDQVGPASLNLLDTFPFKHADQQPRQQKN